jgi:hypothetical protein
LRSAAKAIPCEEELEPYRTKYYRRKRGGRGVRVKNPKQKREERKVRNLSDLKEKNEGRLTMVA